MNYEKKIMKILKIKLELKKLMGYDLDKELFINDKISNYIVDIDSFNINSLCVNAVVVIACMYLLNLVLDSTIKYKTTSEQFKLLLNEP